MKWVISDFVYEVEQETDGRWVAEIPAVPGAMAYGENVFVAMSKAANIAYEKLGMKWQRDVESIDSEALKTKEE